jgi:uncharacterized protein (DUF2164 family)
MAAENRHSTQNNRFGSASKDARAPELSFPTKSIQMPVGDMTIELTKEAKQNALESIQKYFELNLEQPIGNLAAGALLQFILEEIGPSVYNKGVADAQERMQARISELDYEVHADEFQYWRNRDRQPKGRK